MSKLETAIFAAACLGTAAAQAGRTQVPCHDRELMALIGANDGHALELLTAWSANHQMVLDSNFSDDFRA